MVGNPVVVADPVRATADKAGRRHEGLPATLARGGFTAGPAENEGR